MGFFRDLLLVLEPVLIPELATYETEIFAAVVLVSLLIIAVLSWCCLRGKKKDENVCLLGLSDSGKTLLFMRLKCKKYFDTLTSIKENVTEYELPDKDRKPLTLVDVPGDERIRERIFIKYRNSLRAVVLVVDSVNFDKDYRNVAELLFDLLSDRLLHKKKTALLIACNKQDLALARNSGDIERQLEKELTTLHVSRQAKPKSLDGGPQGAAPVTFIKEGKEFEFSDLKSIKVRFVECSARGKSGEEDGGNADISKVKEWLEKLS